MKNPYEVLGITHTATDQEVKTAYRELARKYHPDNYQNNPLADLAKDKMSEINAAYDEIVKERSSNGEYRASQGAGTGGQSRGQFANVREMITQGRIEDAHRTLDGVPVSMRSAEWHFLRGVVLQRKGWLSDARMCYQQAVNMEPSNPEYRSALNSMGASGTPWRDDSYGTGEAFCVPCTGCDICTAALCANCLCNCCTGR